MWHVVETETSGIPEGLVGRSLLLAPEHRVEGEALLREGQGGSRGQNSYDQLGSEVSPEVGPKMGLC